MSETVDKRRLAELRSLLRTIEEAGWEYARVEIDGVTLVVSSDPEYADRAAAPSATAEAAPATDSRPPPPAAELDQSAATAPGEVHHAAPGDVHDGPVETVTSPTIGLFWRSPKPGAPPFVEIGDTVAAGDTVCIVEVMKLMTHVTAPVAGTVQAIHIDNGGMVEHGTALIDIAHSGNGEDAP